MLGSPVLDVAIGMTFIFLTLSFIASAIQEILSSLIQSRPANLFNGIRSLFSGNVVLLEELYLHGIIAGLYKDPAHDFGGRGASVFPWIRNRLQPLLGIRLMSVDSAKLASIDPLLLPAYIPSRAFAAAMIDILNFDKTSEPNIMNTVVLRIKDSIEECHVRNQESRAYDALLALALRAGGDVSTFETGVEGWYSDAMDRVSGWYKKYTQNVLLVIGLILAITFNVDSIRVGTTLWVDRDARQALVTSASTFLQTNAGSLSAPASVQPMSALPTGGTEAPSLDVLSQRLSNTVRTFDNINRQMLLPLGWRAPFSDYVRAAGADPLSIIRTLLGWMITAIALSLGAPFWFDTLNKFMIVRSTVKPQEKSQGDRTKDG